MTIFHINDKVLCVDATPIPHFKGTLADYSFPGGYIEEGATYCVQGFSDCGRAVGLCLAGVPVNQVSGLDLGWSPARFRRVTEGGVSREAEAVVLSTLELTLQSPA